MHAKLYIDVLRQDLLYACMYMQKYVKRIVTQITDSSLLKLGKSKI